MEFKNFSCGKFSYGDDNEYSVIGELKSKYFYEGVTNVNFNSKLFETHW
jgi:hypothetical protein